MNESLKNVELANNEYIDLLKCMARKKFWVMRSAKRTIRIEDMSDAHVKNALYVAKRALRHSFESDVRRDYYKAIIPFLEERARRSYQDDEYEDYDDYDEYDDEENDFLGDCIYKDTSYCNHCLYDNDCNEQENKVEKNLEEVKTKKINSLREDLDIIERKLKEKTKKEQEELEEKKPTKEPQKNQPNVEVIEIDADKFFSDFLNALLKK